MDVHHLGIWLIRYPALFSSKKIFPVYNLYWYTKNELLDLICMPSYKVLAPTFLDIATLRGTLPNLTLTSLVVFSLTDTFLRVSKINIEKSICAFIFSNKMKFTQYFKSDYSMRTV